MGGRGTRKAFETCQIACDHGTSGVQDRAKRATATSILRTFLSLFLCLHSLAKLERDVSADTPKAQTTRTTKLEVEFQTPSFSLSTDHLTETTQEISLIRRANVIASRVQETAVRVLGAAVKDQVQAPQKRRNRKMPSRASHCMACRYQKREGSAQACSPIIAASIRANNPTTDFNDKAFARLPPGLSDHLNCGARRAKRRHGDRHGLQTLQLHRYYAYHTRCGSSKVTPERSSISSLVFKMRNAAFGLSEPVGILSGLKPTRSSLANLTGTVSSKTRLAATVLKVGSNPKLWLSTNLRLCLVEETLVIIVETSDLLLPLAAVDQLSGFGTLRIYGLKEPANRPVTGCPYA
ncbi:hypothetical protein BKA70DRAFT_1226129 [Coprinopsis sp. MPI-PUGE-AT-0042]|nr:hypothetical protein BKA70DRAFT_1226129 [Coprinopsis sp. MPI-PUGE-AT-0042]